jgi:hypothetical protein
VTKVSFKGNNYKFLGIFNVLGAVVDIMHLLIQGSKDKGQIVDYFETTKTLVISSLFGNQLAQLHHSKSIEFAKQSIVHIYMYVK